MPTPDGGLIPSDDEFHEPMLEVDLPDEPPLVEADSTTEITEPLGYQPFDPTSLVTKQDTPGKKEPLLNEAGEVLPEFDERYRKAFEGLMFLGSLSHEFEWMGHTFRIRSLLSDEVLATGVVTAKYKETLGNGLAYRIATAAMCLISVDGEVLPEPIERKSDDYEWAFQKFNYVKSRWFQFTTDAIYNEYLLLEQKVYEVIEAMGKASRPTASVPG